MRAPPFCIVAVLFVGSVTARLSCQDEDGKDVDWYISFKFPRLKDASSFLKQGLAHAYFGPDDDSWTMSNKSIGDKSSFVGNTLHPMYNKNKKNSDELLYILYNDEHPDGNTSYTRGHTKGVVAFDMESGYWLIHSVPKFPPPSKDPFSYPETGEMFGQSFLCITFEFSQADHIGELLLYNEPFIYEYQLPEAMASELPSISAVVKDQYVSEQPWNITKVLESSKQEQFLFFAKYKNFDKDLYSNWLAPYLEADIYTETWQNGPTADKLPSFCSEEFTVENIKQLKFPIQDIAFKTTKDHSKLAVSSNLTKPWICIGDINRTKPQKRRSGGTACLKSASVWQRFYKLVVDVEKCASSKGYFWELFNTVQNSVYQLYAIINR